jgi:hypothetical protein
LTETKPQIRVREFITDRALRTTASRIPGPDDRVRYQAGTRFGCEAGHVCAVLAEDVHVAQRLTADLFEASPPYQTTIRMLAKMGQCICGRSWVRSTPDCHVVMQMHVIGEGWK